MKSHEEKCNHMFGRLDLLYIVTVTEQRRHIIAILQNRRAVHKKRNRNLICGFIGLYVSFGRSRHHCQFLGRCRLQRQRPQSFGAYMYVVCLLSSNDSEVIALKRCEVNPYLYRDILGTRLKDSKSNLTFDLEEVKIMKVTTIFDRP